MTTTILVKGIDAAVSLAFDGASIQSASPDDLAVDLQNDLAVDLDANLAVIAPCLWTGVGAAMALAVRGAS